MRDRDAILDSIGRILEKMTPSMDPVELESVVDSFHQRKDVFLDTVAENGSPLYVVEKGVLEDRARQFSSAFRGELPDVRVFYALKSNSLPALAGILVKSGLGLDASSGSELEIALGCEAKDILFSGPGKTEDELDLAFRHRERVTVLMDSFGELERLEKVAGEGGAAVGAGIRLTVDERGMWRKFGIPLSELPRFMESALRCRHVRLHGLQFHTSWNLDPSNQVRFIERLGDALRKLDRRYRSLVEFIDIGGGFWPPQGEWLQPAETPEGKARLLAGAAAGPGEAILHHKLAASPVKTFAAEIGRAFRASVFPHVDCRVYTEPGRWLCNDAMHILLRVVDRKADDLVITDGGTNAVGWERFESDYFPVINLTRPGLRERECYVMGSLCTPRDLWGYGYFGVAIEPGDVLLIPMQGAYTYSLRQEFIKPLPKVVVI